MNNKKQHYDKAESGLNVCVSVKRYRGCLPNNSFLCSVRALGKTNQILQKKVWLVHSHPKKLREIQILSCFTTIYY